MTLRDAFRIAAKSGDWITPYALVLVLAQWEAAGIDLYDGEVSAPTNGNENARLQPGE